MRPIHLLVAAALVLAALPSAAQDVAVETYTLPNGLTVILHEDHSLPEVTINTWFHVGSKDESPGRTGFAHLFEHLMFMGTHRVPGNQFDVLMESGGGANNASTSQDRTNYYSWGPSGLLPTLLWLDADRMDALGDAMTQEKLDLQRSVVRNERRQSYENAPYGKAWLAIPEALYPAGHPYHHPVIGSHEDLEAATLQDVKSFFATYYVPGNASLVVAGDFDAKEARRVIGETFGAVPVRPVPSPPKPLPVTLDREVRRLVVDKVEFPLLVLIWPSPPYFAEGDAEMDLAAAILSTGTSGRLYDRLVLKDRLAQEVNVSQGSKELSSEFTVEVLAARGADLESIKRTVLEEVDRLRREGPTAEEVARAKTAAESSFYHRMEDLQSRADMLNTYQYYYGAPNSFRRDLDRYRSADAAGVRAWAARTLGEGRLDLRVLPEDPALSGASLDKRPADFPAAKAGVPSPVRLTLANGVPLYVVARPGSGLFAGALVADGGERAVPAEKNGMAALFARMLTAGAGGRSSSAFADAVTAAGASIDASASWHDVRLTVDGLSSRMEEALDLFCDAAVRPNLAAADFERERSLQLDDIRARAQRPSSVAFLVARSALYGKDDPRGRHAAGDEATVGTVTLEDLKEAVPSLLSPSASTLVFVGDLKPEALKAALDKRLSGWKVTGGAPPHAPAPKASVSGVPRLLLVDRPGAPQTFICIARPVAPPADETSRAARECVNTILGGSFTSRLMQNIREKHGYSYGARSAFEESGPQVTLFATSSVQTAVTGKALAEFKREFDALAGGDVSAAELEKARRTVAYDLVSTAETSRSLVRNLSVLVANGRPADAMDAALGALGGVSVEGANALARSGVFGWDSLVVVLVGDRTAVLPQLKAEGFGEPAAATADGAF